MDSLPVEILGEIAGVSIEAYRAMCLIKLFALQLTPDTITQWQIHFGHSVVITAKCISWYKNNKLHRVDGPAMIELDTSYRWYQANGVPLENRLVSVHCDSRVWHYNGKIHRVDGPAMIWADGELYWYRHNILHRDDGPARIAPSGEEWWYRKGKPHRDDGPAYTHPNGTQHWYRNGKQYIPDI